MRHRRLLAFGHELGVDLVELDLVELLTLDHVGLADVADLDLLKHLANNHLDVLVVDRNALQVKDARHRAAAGIDLDQRADAVIFRLGTPIRRNSEARLRASRASDEATARRRAILTLSAIADEVRAAADMRG